MPDLVASYPTRTSATTDAPLEIRRTRTTHDLVQELGVMRSQRQLLENDVAQMTQPLQEAHHRELERQLNARARALAHKQATVLLADIADAGFAWRDIARMVGVSVPAVRRWRQGEPPTGAHLLGIARLGALIETLRAEHLIAQVASWMEMPLVPDAPLTGIDLATDGRLPDLIDLAAGHGNPEALLDDWTPAWRERYASEFEVFEAPDGDTGIRLRSREGD